MNRFSLNHSIFKSKKTFQNHAQAALDMTVMSRVLTYVYSVLNL